jgi:hypothetical protein
MAGSLFLRGLVGRQSEFLVEGTFNNIPGLRLIPIISAAL